MVGIRDTQTLLLQIQQAKAAQSDLVVNLVHAQDRGGPVVHVGQRARWKSRMLNVITLGASNYYNNWKLLNAMKILMGAPSNRPLLLSARNAAVHPRHMNPSSRVFAELLAQHSAAAPSLSRASSTISVRSLDENSLYSPGARGLLEKFLELKQDLIESPPKTLRQLNEHTGRFHALLAELQNVQETASSPLDERTMKELDAAIDYWQAHASESVPQSEFDAVAPPRRPPPKTAPDAKPAQPQTTKPSPPTAPPPAPPAAPPAAAPSAAPTVQDDALPQSNHVKRALANGRNFQILHQDRPETIPLRNKAATPRAGPGHAYYLEQQQRMFCGKHALNAMFGAQVISKQDYVGRMQRNIIDFLGSREMAEEAGLLNDSGLSSADQIVLVLDQMRAEGKIQLPGETHNQYFEGGSSSASGQVAQLSKALDAYPGDRMIAGNAAHWVALRRDDAGRWWELDSMKRAPEPFDASQYVQEAGGSVNFITFGDPLNLP